MSNADVDDYQKSMATASDVTSGFTGMLQGVISGVRNLGIAMTAASAATGAAMTSMAMSAARVNEAYREVDTITSETADSQEEYGEIISHINTEMGVNASRLDVINALYQSVSAGVDEAHDSQKQFLETSARLSVVGRVDLATTVDILSTAMNGYGRDVVNAKRASDALFATVQFGKTTMEELAPVMGRVIALGSEMGASIEGLGAAMSVLTKRGFETRIAATGLRAVLRGLLRPSEDLQLVLRDIALEQDLFAKSMENGSEEVRQIAEDYRSATESIKELEEAQAAARNTVEDTSLKIQEARLLQSAIEQGRREEVEDAIQTDELQGATLEELETIIEDYRLEVNKARVEEERARQNKKELEEQVSDLESQFKEQLSTSGDLQGSIGQLVVEEEGFVNTLVQVRKRAKEQDIAMSDLFNRSRALQASLSILGDDGEELTRIFQAMGEGEEELNEQLKETQEEFDLTDEQVEDLREGVEEVEDIYEETQGASQSLRDVTSELREAYQDLGQIFLGVVVRNAERVADFAENLVDKFENLDESVRENIARFMALAVGIGAVLGPLLILGSQVALLVTSLAVGFIPIIGTAAVAIGGFASSLRTLMEDGADAETLLNTMQSAFDKLKSFAIALKDAFMDEVLPGMETFSDGVIGVFSELVDAFNRGGGDAEGTVEKLGQIIGDIFQFIGEVLLNNKEQIGSFFETFVSFIVEDLVPAMEDAIPRFVSFIETIKELGDDDRTEAFEKMSSDFAVIAEAVMETIEVFEKFGDTQVEGESKTERFFDALFKLDAEVLMALSGTIREISVNLLEMVQILFMISQSSFVQSQAKDFVLIMEALVRSTSSLIDSFTGTLQAVNKLLGPLVSMEDILTVLYIGVISPLILSLVLFKFGLVALVGVIELLSWLFDGLTIILRNLGFLIIGSVAPALAIILKVIQLLVPEVDSAKQAFVFLLKEIKNLGSYLKSKGSELWSKTIDGLAITKENFKRELLDMFSMVDSWAMQLGLIMYSAGIDSMKALANGIVQGTKDHVEGAIDDTAQAIRNRFHNSPPKEGPMARNPMDGAGRETIQALADGTSENKSSVLDEYDSLSSDISSMDISPEQDNPLVPPDQMDEFLKEQNMQGIESDVLSSDSNGMIPQDQMPGDMGAGRKIVIDEKAVFFEAGAFQGVSDEELPAKVRDVVDASMDEIVDALEAKGVEFQ